MKPVIGKVMVVVLSVGMVLPHSVHALTEAELVTQLNSIKARLVDLQAQVDELRAAETTGTTREEIATFGRQNVPTFVSEPATFDPSTDIDPVAARELIDRFAINEDLDVVFVFGGESFSVPRETIADTTEAEAVLEEWEDEFKRIAEQLAEPDTAPVARELFETSADSWPEVEAVLEDYIAQEQFAVFSDVWQVSRGVFRWVDEVSE